MQANEARARAPNAAVQALLVKGSRKVPPPPSLPSAAEAVLIDAELLEDALPAPPPASVPVPSAPPSIAPVTFERPLSAPRPDRSRPLGFVLVSVAVLFGFLAMGGLAVKRFAFPTARTASLVITVAGPAGKPVSDLAVTADGKRVCDSSPCVVRDLDDGIHFVEAEASGHVKTAPRAIRVESAKETAVHVELAPKAP